MTAPTRPARRRAARALALALLVPAFGLGLAGQAFAEVTAVAGGAVGVGVDSGPMPAVTLPAGGGALPVTNGVATVGVPGLLSTGAVAVATQGAPGPTGSVQSSAQVAGLTVGPGALAVDAVGSRCGADEAGATGSATIGDVYLSGVPTAVATAPGTVLDVAGLGALHVNEQVVTGTAPYQSVTVNALRLELDQQVAGTGSIVVGQSVCGVAGDGVVVPTGAVGGVLLTGLVAVVVGASQIRRHRRTGGPVTV